METNGDRPPEGTPVVEVRRTYKIAQRRWREGSGDTGGPERFVSHLRALTRLPAGRGGETAARLQGSRSEEQAALTSGTVAH